MTWFVHFWAKHEDGRAAAGGYVRCDSLAETFAMAAHCKMRGLAVQVRTARA
jgi:hypothetical protein